VKKVASSTKYLSGLVKNASKMSASEFIQLIENSIRQLESETKHIGSLQIVGRLVKMSPRGEVIIVGDIHGDLNSFVHILENSGFLKKSIDDKDVSMIFLGDYGDRGAYSPEVYYVTLKLKEQFPENVILMRGNHEGPDDLLADPHDLPYQFQERFGEKGQEAYAKIRRLFDCLYNAVLINERYVLLHGGVPSKGITIDDLANAHKTHPKETHLEEILWSDPSDEIKGTYPSPRGAGKLFGEDVTEKFLKMLNVEVLIRGHEPSENGFKTNHHNKVLTLFSRKGAPYYNNYGAYLQIDISKKVENATQLIPYIRKF
jgi:protein phosphatase